MGGEPCPSLDLTLTGAAGDRRFAFGSSRAPAGKPLLASDERAAMLLFQAQISAEGSVEVVTPEGSTFRVSDPRLLQEIAASLAHPAELLLRSSERPMTDVRPFALHSLATAVQLSTELGSDGHGEEISQRLRSNLLIDFAGGEAFPEDSLPGRSLRLGPTVELRISERIPRCRMVALHPVTAELDRAILNHMARQYGGRAGVYASVLTPGTITVGDPVMLI